MYDPPGQFRIRLRGWKALALLSIVAAVMMGWFSYIPSPDTDKTREAIALYFANRYINREIGDLSPDELAEAARTPERAQRLANMTKVKVLDMDVRGYGQECVARIRLQVNGEIPPDGKSIHYVRLHHSFVFNGWSVRRESTPMFYWLSII